MFSSYAILCVFFRCFFYCLSQEVPAVHVYNTSLNVRENNRGPADYDTQDHNLWLISSQDPIPARLSGRWPPSSYVPGAIGTFRSNDYTAQSAEQDLQNRESPLPLNNPLLRPPVLRYDRILTAENRRQSSNEGGFVVPNSEAVLVQLPIEITEGLWERPQRNLEYSINGRQNVETDNINIKFDETPGREKPIETPAMYPPILQLTSRLPNIPQGESDIVTGENYEVQNQQFTTSDGYSNDANISATLVSLPESLIRDVWLFRQDDQRESSPQNLAEIPVYESYFTEPQPNGQRVHNIGNILTSEDIELLERLGILSSLIIQPISSENVTRNFTNRENLEREYDTEPVIIDNNGQSHTAPNKRENTTLEDVVLIDIPQFTSAAYHTNIPENTGIETEGTKSPYSVDQSKNTLEENVKATETNGLKTNASVSDKQLLEILEFFNLNVGDIFNLSLPARVEKKTDLDRSSKFSEYTRNASFDKLQDSSATLQQNSVNSGASLPALNISIRNATPPNNPLRRNATVLIPAISNGKIQPRLLDELPAKENEIMERLIHKAVPVSERKLEMLKKLEIIPQPYFFGFRQDDGNGTLQHRNETSDSQGVVKGSYGYRDPMGVYRNVNYIADNNGFHAVVKSNEPGIVSHNTADAVFMSETPPLAALLKMMAYRRSKIETNVTSKA